MARTPPTASSPDRTLAYAKAAVLGEIVAGPHVRNACKRHIADLKRKDGFWFDQDAAVWARTQTPISRNRPAAIIRTMLSGTYFSNS